VARHRRLEKASFSARGGETWGFITIQNALTNLVLQIGKFVNALNPELNSICYLLALLELTIFFTLAG
jgi:hypothetical protein